MLLPKSTFLLATVLVTQFFQLGHAAAINAPQIRAEAGSSDATQALEHWKKNETPLPSYFDDDDAGKNFENSGTANWYNQWIVDKVKELPDDYQRLGEATFFAVQVMGISEKFNCSLARNGCEKMPDTSSIIRHFLQNETSSPGSAMETSRRVNFVFERMNSFVKASKIYHDNLEVAKTQLMTKIPNLVQSFTPQKKLEADINCQVFKTFIDLAWSLLQWQVSSQTGGWSTLAGLAGPPGAIVAGGIGQLGAFVSFGITVTQKMIDMGVEIDKMKKQAGSHVVDMGEDFELRMESGYVEGICNEKDDNAVKRDQLQAHIGKLFPLLKLISEGTMQATLSGNSSALASSGISFLASTIARPSINRAMGQMSAGLSLYEGRIAQLYEEIYISYAWANSQCYVTMNYFDQKTYDNHCANKKPWWNQKSRYCDPATGLVAQAQCWTNRKKDNQEVELIGIDALKDSNMNISQVLEDSVKNYRQFGAKGARPTELVKGDPLHFDFLLNRNSSLANLPTCYSPLLTLEGFQNRKGSGGMKTRNQNFPPTCGPYASNETKAFMDRLGLGYNQSHFAEKDTVELMETIVTHNARNFSPFERFMSFCEMGIQFPTVKHGVGKETAFLAHRYRMGRGKSQYCDAIKEETRTMVPREANRWFCTDSQTSKKLFAEERNWADNVVPFMKSHARLCKDWKPSIYTLDEPDVGRWQGSFGKMKMPKDIPYVDFSQYRPEQKDASDKDLDNMANTTETQTEEVNKKLIPEDSPILSDCYDFV
ncbi:uncharacterized protein PAC_18341 [Phialocephala subalpina]|uniref:Uncharacterized protein n=1 Tax=Phialocephala subalpina TaxID=576137 RepID=A0A1L7XTT3_9HELO|nr:uncharacterized protein PAC_18341 [Phialocephala subalpina]